MAIYVRKESAIDDTIQTPDDVGVDLDQIEEDIAGKDGIEAHRDEIEDAVEGIVGDPIEEMYMSIYETEYNTNQLLECLAIHELQAESMGRTLVLEAFDIKDFFTKVKNIIINSFKQFLEAMKKIGEAILNLFHIGSAYVTNNKERLNRGFGLLTSSDEYEGYKYNHDAIESWYKGLISVSKEDIEGGFDEAISEYEEEYEIDSYDIDKKVLNKAFKKVNKSAKESITEEIEDMTKALKGSSKENIIGYYSSADEVYDRATDKTTIKEIDASKKKTKEIINGIIDRLNKEEKNAKGNNAETNRLRTAAKAATIIQKYQQAVATNLTKIVRDEIKQAIGFAKFCISKANAQSSTNESSNMFSSIKLI